MREQDFANYLADIESEGQRALKEYGMLVVPGAEVTQNRIRAKKNSHIIALGVKKYISADQSADAILREIRRQGALSIACHPHHTTTRRIEISTDLFSVTSLKHYPYVANSDFHKPKHLYSWKTLIRSEKSWPAVRQALRSNVDVAITLFRNGPACV